MRKQINFIRLRCRGSFVAIPPVPINDFPRFSTYRFFRKCQRSRTIKIYRLVGNFSLNNFYSMNIFPKNVQVFRKKKKNKTPTENFMLDCFGPIFFFLIWIFLMQIAKNCGKYLIFPILPFLFSAKLQ